MILMLSCNLQGTAETEVVRDREWGIEAETCARTRLRQYV